MESLAEIGLATMQRFKLFEEIEQLSSVKNQIQEWPKPLFLSQFDRFELWAVNLGVFVMGHGSLDYRIRDSESMKEGIYKMMNNLNRSLDEVLDYLNGNIGQGDEDSDTDSEMGSDMDLLLDSIKDPIDRLYKLAVWIRNPATRLASSRARDFKQIDEESNVDLLECFENYDYDYVSSLFLEYAKHKAMQEDPTVEHDDAAGGDGEINNKDQVWEPIRKVLELNKDKISNGTESYLVHRIAQANGRRRRQFAYWRRHKDKLREHASVIMEPSARKRFNAIHMVDGRIEKTKTSLSVTTATQLRLSQANGKEIFEKENGFKFDVSEYAPSAWNPSKDIVSFPSPPKVSTTDNFFECPYCYTICPVSFLSEKAWRAHLIRDLRPYVCTYERCLNSEQLYDNRDEWIQHETSTHQKVFQCPKHEEETFTTLAAYEEHTQDYHKNEAISPHFTKSSMRNAHRSCPICSIVFGSVPKLQSHIALHLERFAMFSLPRSTDNAETDDTESQSDSAQLESDRSLNMDLDQDSYATDESRYTQLKTYENLQQAARKAKEEAEKAEEEAKLTIEGEIRKENEGAEKTKQEIDKLKKRIQAETKAAIEESVRKAEETAQKAELAPIKFKDAVGRKFSFPFHLCNTWQGMEELIKQAFLQVDVLGPHVQEGHYDLIGPNGDIILPSVWEKVVEPDWTITMTMWPLDKKFKEAERTPAKEAARLQSEEVIKAQAEARARIEEEHRLRLIKAEDEARAEAEAEARVKIKEEIRLQLINAEAKARAKAEEAARLRLEGAIKAEAEVVKKYAEEDARMNGMIRVRGEAGLDIDADMGYANYRARRAKEREATQRAAETEKNEKLSEIVSEESS